MLAPFPPNVAGLHGGSRAVAGAVQAAASAHDVILLYGAREGEETSDPETLSRCEFAQPIPLADPPRRRSGSGREILWPLLRGIPMWAAELWRAPFQPLVEDALEEWRPDVIQVEMLVAAAFLGGIDARGIPVVFVDHDASSRPVEGFGHATRLLKVPLRALDRLAWRRFERRVLKSASAVVTFSERDLAAAQRAGARNPVQIPLALASRRRVRSLSRTDNVVVFAGNFRHPPNADAAVWLANEIFPPVRARHPDAVLQLVGRDPPDEVRALASRHIVVTGEVPDVRPFLEQAAVVVAPLRTGGGVRVKVLEALSAGAAVVATSLAVEGVTAARGREVVVAESSTELAAAVSALLGDANLRRRLSEHASHWAEENVGHHAAAEAYNRLYLSLLSARAPR